MPPPSLAEWLKAFRELHERAKQGALSAADQATYRQGREELARALLAAQHLALKPGETPRRALRVARALQVDLDLGTARERAVTVDLGAGGFSCLLARAPRTGEEIGFSLRVPAAQPFAGRARIADVRPQPGNARVSFQLLNLDDAERERLETFVFDTVLAQLAP